MAGNESASHWCKGVLEEAQTSNPAAALASPAQVNYYPTPAHPPPPPGSDSQAQTDAAAEYYKQYYQYYQSYYQQQQQQYTQPQATYSYLNAAAPPYRPPVSSSFPTSNPPPPPQLAPANPTYASAVIQGQQGWRPPPQVQPKKPNPSRFAAAPPVAAPAPNMSRALPVNPKPAAPAATKGVPKDSNSPWPDSLKSFVERAFSRCEVDADRAFIEKALKQLITSVTNDGRLHKHRWDLEPIPVPPSALPSPSNSISSFNQSGKSTYASELEKVSGKRKKSRFQDGPSPAPSPSPKGRGKGSIYGPGSDSVTAADLTARQNRANRFMKEKDKYQPSSVVVGGKGGKGKKRQRVELAAAPATQSTTLSDFDLEQLIVVGTCSKIEKDYLRLTSAPDPSTVRPFPILQRAFEHVKKKWETDKEAPECYVYMCSQLKSLRQDLMVQHIRNGFTVDVYEFHARVALESCDLNEYNQCQTQLKQMYDSGLSGSKMEFVAYRILYYLYLQGNQKYQQGNQDLAHLMAAIAPEAYEHHAVKHALRLREAAQLENYHKFFRLYRETPNLGACIIDLMLDTWRFKALQRMVKCYKPSISVDFVTEELGFDSIEECLEFVAPLGVVTQEQLVEDGSSHLVIDTKTSVVNAVSQDDKLLL